MKEVKQMAAKNYMYAVRDVATGKLVTNLTNPGHKYWEKKGNCLNAIEAYNKRSRYCNRRHEGPLELVTFELVEVVQAPDEVILENKDPKQITFEEFVNANYRKLAK